MTEILVTYVNNVGCGCHGYWRPKKASIQLFDDPLFLCYNDPETDQWDYKMFNKDTHVDNFIEENDIKAFRLYTGSCIRNDSELDHELSDPCCDKDDRILTCTVELNIGDTIYLSDLGAGTDVYLTRDEAEVNLKQSGYELNDCENGHVHGTHEIFELSIGI